jgi:D-sedoheptulose 7-phosphate isomerase
MSNLPDRADVFQRAIDEHLSIVAALSTQEDTLTRIGSEMVRAVNGGKKVMWCGNGGSAADSQHLAAEFVGRFRRERRGLASIALTTDSSVLTAIGNDYGYEHVFRRQVEALCAEGDVVVGISTSGNSRNVLLALQSAKELGAFTVAFTGESGGLMGAMADAAIRVKSKDTARIQEGHILCGHMLCDWVELSVCSQLSAESELAVL